jgi:hypothetical protein
MRIRLAALIGMAFGATLLLAACDNFVEYTIINDTDQELLTWPFFKDCGLAASDPDDYFGDKVVKARDRLDYFRIHGRRVDPKCVQVMTKDRRLVLVEKYEYGGTYIVSEPLQPFGDPIPERDDLPDPSLGDSLRTWVEGPPLAVAFNMLLMLFGLGFLAAFAFAVFIIVRFFWRHYVGKR